MLKCISYRLPHLQSPIIIIIFVHFWKTSIVFALIEFHAYAIHSKGPHFSGIQILFNTFNVELTFPIRRLTLPSLTLCFVKFIDKTISKKKKWVMGQNVKMKDEI